MRPESDGSSAVMRLPGALLVVGVLGLAAIGAARWLGSSFQERERFRVGGAVAMQIGSVGKPSAVLSYRSDGDGPPEFGPIVEAASASSDDRIVIVAVQAHAPDWTAARPDLAERLGVKWRAHHRFYCSAREVAFSDVPIDGMDPWKACLHTRPISPSDTTLHAVTQDAVALLGARSESWTQRIASLASAGSARASTHLDNVLWIEGHRATPLARITFYVGFLGTLLGFVGLVWMVGRRLTDRFEFQRQVLRASRPALRSVSPQESPPEGEGLSEKLPNWNRFKVTDPMSRAGWGRWSCSTRRQTHL